MSDIEKVDLESKDLVAERVERLKAMAQSISRNCGLFWETRLMKGRSATPSPGLEKQMPFVRRKCLQLLPFVPMRMQASIGAPLRTFISRAITLKC